MNIIARAAFSLPRCGFLFGFIIRCRCASKQLAIRGVVVVVAAVVLLGCLHVLWILFRLLVVYGLSFGLVRRLMVSPRTGNVDARARTHTQH